MGIFKEELNIQTSIKPSDIIEGLRKKIKRLEKEIKELKDAKM